MNLRDQFEQRYSEMYENMPVEILKGLRRDNTYADIHLDGAFKGWLLYEDEVSDQAAKLAALEDFMKDFFIAYKAFGVHRSPIARRREDDYQRDARERLESLFERGCKLVNYDETEISDRILAECKNELTVSAPVEEPELQYDLVHVKELTHMRYGNLVLRSTDNIKIGYAFITGQHWLQTYDDGEAKYALHPKASSAEYVDVFVTKSAATSSSIDKRMEKIHTKLLNGSLFTPAVKTVFDTTRGFAIRFMIEHGKFISEMLKEDK